MLRAFAKIAKEHPMWSLVFAGNGEVERGRDLSGQLGISHQVKWLGWVTGAEKDTAFRDASVYCLPSYAEGFPMGVLDAWSYGLPVITTPVGGIPDIADDGNNMLLFAPGDVGTLAIQLERVFSNATLRRRIAQESENLANTKFNIQTINKQIGSLYEELSVIRDSI